MWSTERVAEQGKALYLDPEESDEVPYRVQRRNQF